MKHPHKVKKIGINLNKALIFMKHVCIGFSVDRHLPSNLGDGKERITGPESLVRNNYLSKVFYFFGHFLSTCTSRLLLLIISLCLQELHERQPEDKCFCEV